MTDPPCGLQEAQPAFDADGTLPDRRGRGHADLRHRDDADIGAAWHDAIESIRDGFALFDEHDRLVICNHRYGEIDGLGPELMVVGTSWQAMLRAGVERDRYVSARGRADAYIAERRAHHRRADGTVLEEQLADRRWVQIRQYRTSDRGTVATRTDITELKQRERTQIALSEELRTQYLRFDAALNNMIQGLCMFDADQRLIVCNARYLEMYGFSSEIVRPGITLREIMEYSVSLGNYRREDALRAISERPDTAEKREQAVLHQRLNDGRVIAVMHQPMPHGGSVATYEDVTQTVHAEEALRDYAARLERSNRELQDFASIASHDLQEPLRKIEAFGDRLVARCGAELSDAGRVYVDRMQDAARRMRLLINDLLTYSRVTTTARPFARGRSRPDRQGGDVRPPGRDRAGRRPDPAGRSAGDPGRRHADAPAAAEPAQQRAEVPLRGTGAGGASQRAPVHARAPRAPRRSTAFVRAHGCRQRHRLQAGLRRSDPRHLPAPARPQRISRHRHRARHLPQDPRAPRRHDRRIRPAGGGCRLHLHPAGQPIGRPG